MFLRDKEYSKQAIKARMLDAAAREWGYAQYELDAFDPLVDLLMGAIAKELEKAYQHLGSNLARLNENLSTRLIPEVWINAQPSFTVVKIAPSRQPEMIDRANFKITSSIQQQGEEVSVEFGPIVKQPLQNWDVKYMLSCHGLFELSMLEKTKLADIRSHETEIFLGLGIDAPFNLSNRNIELYVDWLNDPRKISFINILKYATWSVGETTPVVHNVHRATEENLKQHTLKFQSLFSSIYSLEDYYDLYKAHFFELRGLFDSGEFSDIAKSSIPEIIQKSKHAEGISKDTVWIKLKVPHHALASAMSDDLYCRTNCIPVVNLQHNEETHRVLAPFKICSIHPKGSFVEIEQVENVEGKVYRDINRADLKAGPNVLQTYQVLDRNVHRLHHGKAEDIIEQVLDLIKDDRNAFAAFKPDWVTAELDSIKQSLNRMYEKVGMDSIASDEGIFIGFENEQDQDIIRVKFWSTLGAIANGIPIGTQLEVDCLHELQEYDGCTIQKSSRGRDLLPEKERVKHFNFALNSRRRIVTTNDFHFAIRDFLADFTVLNILVNRDFAVGIVPNEGYVPKFNIHVLVKREFHIAPAQAQSMEQECASYLLRRTFPGIRMTVKIQFSEN